MKNTITKKQIRIFLAVAFVLGAVLQVTGSIFARQENRAGFQVCLMACMYMPLLGVLAARVPLKGMGFKPQLKGNIRWILYGMWMPALLGILGAVLYFIIFPSHLDTGFQMLRLSMGEEMLAQMEAQGLTLGMVVLISCIQSLTIAPFFNMFLALGEEIGWRGTLYPYLKSKLGKTKGRCLGGILWGVWHWPVIFLAGYEYGTDYIGAPFAGPVVFCLSTMVMGILEDHIYEKTKTIWAPSLLHGAFNALQILAYLTGPEYSDYMILGPAFVGVISMIPMAVAAVGICRKDKDQDNVILNGKENMA